VQGPVLGEEAHLEATQSTELRQVAGVSVAVARQEVVVDDQPVGARGDEPPLQRYPVHRGEGDVLVVQPRLVRTTQHRCAASRGRALRREEVALLASISTDYYARIEQGRRHAPEAVLDGIARVLRLDPDERQYAFELARASAVKTGRASRPRQTRQQIPAGVQALMDAMVSAPAIVHNGRLDIVGANALGRALFADVFDTRFRRPNLARFIFLDGRATEFYPQWETIADSAVAILRVEAGHSPYTRTSPTSSGNSPRAATNSRRVGRPTTGGRTAAASSSSAIRWSETSRSAMKPSRSPTPGDSPCSATPPNPAPRPTTR
jgi:transcriptional regulator with XRE-family HTH domain